MENTPEDESYPERYHEQQTPKINGIQNEITWKVKINKDSRIQEGEHGEDSAIDRQTLALAEEKSR